MFLWIFFNECVRAYNIIFNKLMSNDLYMNVNDSYFVCFNIWLRVFLYYTIAKYQLYEERQDDAINILLVFYKCLSFNSNCNIL